MLLIAADPDVHGKVLLLGQDEALAVLCGLAPPAGRVRRHLLLPVVLQQQAEAVELMDAGGQPKGDNSQNH